MGLIWGRRLEKKIGELIIVFSLLFSISLAQTDKTSDAEIAVRKSGIALEQEATKKIEPVFPPIAKAARASGEVKVELTIRARKSRPIRSAPRSWNEPPQVLSLR